MRPSAARVVPDAALDGLAADVAASLARSPRTLPSQYLYDDLGSALFDAICHLPWYRITRTERRLIATHGPAIFRRASPISRIVELGPGSGEKLALLIASGAPAAALSAVHLVDVSGAALALATSAVSGATDARIVCHEAAYESGLRSATAPATPGRTLVVFLGSNIGNFDPSDARALLRRIRTSLTPGDMILIGVDLVKPERDLLLAYDDPLGVTAAFNRNLLVRLNRELDANFDLDQFTHKAVWNAADSRVEMHLVSATRQRIRIPGAGLDFTMDAGETIWTESSYKYRLDDLASLLADAGFRIDEQWIEDGFALAQGGLRLEA